MLPTLYEYYTSGGIQSGLTAAGSSFMLNNKNFTILGGSMDYFRTHPDYWRDRLKQLRAAGLNTVDTHIPWNLHEPSPGAYDFGNGGSDFQEFLGLHSFLTMIQEEDLLAVVRPGPYIGSGIDFGGFPSWLLRTEGVKLRSTDERFMVHVRRYFSVLFAILAMFQFTKEGPIIGFQIEHDFTPGLEDQSVEYLMALKEIYVNNSLVEMLFISGDVQHWFSLENVSYAANFHFNVDRNIELLKWHQNGAPMFVMEYWSGSFDSFLHYYRYGFNEKVYTSGLRKILDSGASVNIYVFYGGTTFGFLSGALYSKVKGYVPLANSYDFDAPISESGDYKPKYFSTKSSLKNATTVNLNRPSSPILRNPISYFSIRVKSELKLFDVLNKEGNFYESRRGVIPMELLPINKNSGQSYGYIVYRAVNLDIPINSSLQIFGHVRDMCMLLVNGELVSDELLIFEDLQTFCYWKSSDAVLSFDESYSNATLDLIVENSGRVSTGNSLDDQYKGLWEGNVTLNGTLLLDWKIYPLEFKKAWTNNLQDWKKLTLTSGPTLYKAYLSLNQTRDTYIDMQRWHRGIVIINGFVLARYFKSGPQKQLYLPGPLLRNGTNEIVIFEHFNPHMKINFLRRPSFPKVDLSSSPRSDIPWLLLMFVLYMFIVI